MKHKIFVHIGLPKTATTSLQTDCFPRIARDDIEYLGVFQPRDESIQNEIYWAFAKALTRSGKSADLRESIARRLEAKTLIFSEEMITVSEPKSSWKEKLANLSMILEGFDYEIIVTVREPVEAMFSYYCEVYPLLGPGRHSFVDAALRNETMQIFHYDKLFSELSRHFEIARLHFFKFEDLVINDAGALDELVTGTRTSILSAPLPNLNHRSRMEGHVVTRHFFTGADLLRCILPQLGSTSKKPSSKTFARLLKWGRRFRLRPIIIEAPQDDEILSLKASMCEGNQVLAQRFGLEY